MTLGHSFKTLLCSVILFFYQQGLANDTHDLEEYREYQKKNWRPASEIQQRQTGQPVICPLENIRIGFVRLNLQSEDVFGDGRLEICEDYEVSEQDFNRMINFYFNYVEMPFRKVRIQRALRLIHRIFAININKTNGHRADDKELINTTAKSLFEQLFLSENTEGASNPSFQYFYGLAKRQHNYVGVNNRLILMFLAFLGPHFLSRGDLDTYFKMLDYSYTGESIGRVFIRDFLSGSMNKENSPQSIGNQLNAVGLDKETALLIGLTAMATAAFEYMNSGLGWPDTLEKLLRRYLPYEILAIVYNNMANFCSPGHPCSVPNVMFSLSGMQEFTHSILGIDPTTETSSERQDYRSDYAQDSDIEGSTEDQDPSIVIQYQNEVIAQLRRELANQTATEEAGAAGGASGGAKECPICLEPLKEMMGFESCEHVGFCRGCIEQCIKDQRGCPFCRIKSNSYRKLFDMSSR